MSLEWECLVYKKIGDDVSGSFGSNAGSTRFNGLADFADDMSDYNGDQAKFDANWIPNDSTRIRGNPSTDVIDWQQDQDDTDDNILFDLWSHGIFPSDTNWTLRWKWTVTAQDFASPNNEIIMLRLTSDSAGLNNGVLGEYVGFAWSFNSLGGAMFIFADAGNDAFPNDMQVAFNTLMGSFTPTWTRYFELKRTSATTAEATIYSDASYTVPVEKVRGSFVTSLTNFRYIQLTNEDTSTSTGVKGTGTIDDITFFNNTEGALDSGLEAFLLHGAEDLDPFATPLVPTLTKTILPGDDGDWIQTGSGTSISSAIISGWGTDAIERRVRNDLQTNYTFTMDDLNWTVEFKVNITGNGNASHPIMVLANTVSNPSAIGGTFDQIGINNNTTPNKLTVRFTDGFTIGSASSVPDGATFIPFPENVDTWVRLERINGDTLRLSVFSDPGFTTHLPGSPNVMTIPSSFNPTNLFAMHSGSSLTGGGGRTLTGTVRDIDIYKDSNYGLFGGNVLNEDFSTYGTPVPADHTDTFDSATGWTTTDSTRVRIEDEQGFLFFMAQRDNTNDQIAFDLGALINPGPNILSDQWLLQFKLSFTTVGLVGGAPEYLFVGIGDLDQTAGTGDDGTLQDYLGAWFRGFTPTGQRIKSVWADNQFVDNLNTGNNISYDFDQGETLWVQIIRDGQDLTLRLYDDPAYSNLIEEVTETFTGVTNLRYLKVSNLKDAAASAGTLDATIDDVSFWDGRIASCDPVTTTFTEDFSYASQALADNSWPSTDLARLDPFPSELSWDISGAVEDAIFHNLGVTINGNFRIRAKIDLQNISSVSANGKGFYWGISSITGTRINNQDFIGLAFFVDSDVADQKIRLQWTNFQIPGTNQVDIRTSTDVQIYYVEILRTSDTAITVNVYSDAGYTSLTDTASAVMTTGVNGLKYLKAYSGSSAGGANTMDGVLDDIEVLYDTDSVWASTFLADMYVDDCQENMNYNYSSILGAAGNRSIAFDLGFVLRNQWVLRFNLFISQLEPNPNGPCFWLGFSDSDETVPSNVDQNHIGFGFTQSGGAKIYGGNNGTGIIFVCSTTQPFNIPRVLVPGTTSYWELIRLNADELQITEFADPNYTFPVRTDTATMTTGGLGEDITGLRFLKLCNRTISSLPTLPGQYIIDDIKVWDGVVVADALDTAFGPVGEGKKTLQLLSHVQANGLVTPETHMNLDFTTSYDNSTNIDGAGLGKVIGLSEWRLFGSDTLSTAFMDACIHNNVIGISSVDVKYIRGTAGRSNVVGPATPPDKRTEVAGWWNKPFEFIDRILMAHELGDAGFFDTDTDGLVFGSD